MNVLRLVGLVILPAALLGMAPVGDATIPATLPVSSLGMPILEDDCILLCSDAPHWCNEGEHDAWWYGTGGPHNWGDGRHSVSNPCWDGTCDEKHGGCEETFAMGDFDTLREGLMNEDPVRVRRALDAMGETFAALDAETSAIRVLGCDGHLVAYFPVSAAVLDVLAE